MYGFLGLSGYGVPPPQVAWLSVSFPIAKIHDRGDLGALTAAVVAALGRQGYRANVAISHGVLSATIGGGPPFNGQLVAAAVSRAAVQAGVITGGPQWRTASWREFQQAAPSPTRLPKFANVSGFGGLDGFGLLGGDQVTRYGADLTFLTLSLYGDASTQILAMADMMAKDGWLASFSQISPGHLYSTAHVVVSKNGNAAFAVNDAKAELAAAAVAESLNLMQVADFDADAVVFAGQAIGTALPGSGLPGSDTYHAGATSPPTCSLLDPLACIPSWAKWVAGGAVALYAVAQVATIAKAVRR